MISIENTLIWRIAAKRWEESSPIHSAELYWPSIEDLFDQEHLSPEECRSLIDHCRGRVECHEQEALDRLERRISPAGALA